MRRIVPFFACLLLSASPAFAQDVTCGGAGGYLVQKHADAGNAEAQFTLSQTLGQAHCTAEERVAAIDWLQRAATQNHTDATFLLGVRYVIGIDVPVDASHGLSLLEIAADAGHLEAQFQYAMIRLESARTDDHRNKALYWLGAAASQGDTKAALTLGHIYADGLHGITRQICWATDWFDAATLLAKDARVDISRLIPRDLACEL